MVHDSAEGDFSFRDYLSCKLNFVKWPPCGTDPETSRTKKASWLGRCCRRLKSTGEEPDLEAGVPPAVSKTHSKISRGNSVSFASAPSSTSANEELMSHAVPFDPEEFLRPVCQSDLVDRFYSKLAAEYEAAAAASASGLAEEGLLPWRDSGAAFSLSPTTKSENMASSRSWNVGPADSSSYAATRRASSLGDASAFGRLDAEDTEPSHVPSKDDEGQSPKAAAPEVQLEHNPERSPPARPSRPSRSAPLISLESIDDVNVEVIRSPSGQVKQKHLVFAMVEEEPVFKTALKSVQFVGVDSNAPEESPTRNRLADGAGPLPPREEKAIETSPRGDAEVTSCVQDVHIELDLEDKKKERRRESTSSAESKTVPRVPRVSDEDALAALEVAQWQPRKDQTKVPTQCSLSTEEREDSPSPLPSPPVAPATPAPGASPGPSRSRAAAAAAAAAAAMTGAAAGARSAMSAAGNRVSIGGAALATLVSPEAAPDRASRSSVFSGRFMPLSLWAQAESTTPPPSGPGSPEQKQDVKLSEVLDGDSPVQEGEKKAERLQKMPSKESAGAAEADAAHCGHATLPTPPIAPAERKGATRGSSAPPDPCRSKSDGEEERAVLPRPMSADSMAEKDRKAVSSMKLVVTPTKEADASPPFTASLASTSSPVRGRQGSKHMTSTSRGHLSPSPAGPATPQDSKVEREAREELQISRSNSRPPAESPKDGAEREEVLPDVLFSAPPAEPDDRISTTRMPSVVPTEAGDTPRAAFAEATETRAIEVVEAETATPSPHSEELRASQVESRESQESHVSSIESASPERRRHTHFLGPCQSAQTSRSRSGSRKSCIASVGPEHPELRVSTSLSGPEGNSDGLRARMPSRPCFADRSASPVTDEVLPVNTVDFTFACADDGVDDAAGPTATRSEEETTIAEDTQASDGWCMSNSSTAVGADVKIFRREEHRPEMESTVDPFEVKRIETRKEVEELEPSFAEEADPKTASETSAAAWGTLDEDHFSEGLDARKSVPRGRRKEAKEARRQRNRGRSTSYQDALDCLRLQAGLGMELTVCR